MEKIISFDIWDTIIKRKCHPEEVKLHVAKYIFLKYNNKLKDNYKNIYSILKKRNEIETEICNENERQGYNAECKIIEVFKRLENSIFKDILKRSIAEELLEEEINQEKKVIFVNPDIIPIFEKYKNLKIYCISDFYMGAGELARILEHLNLDIKIEKIFSSSDYLYNKRTGDLFRIAEEEIGVKPEEHIHVGDNIYSDIESANKIGIKTIRIKRNELEFEPNRNRSFYFDKSKLKRVENNLENRLFNIGVKLTPILYYFVYAIVEHAIKNNIKKVYYCTREGETFIKIHELIKDNNPFGLDVPECEILEVSRMATFSASLKEFSITELMRLWSQYRIQSMKALFRTLAIDIKPYEKYIEKYDIKIKEDIVEPWFDIRVQTLCNDEEFKEKINKELAIKKQELIEYFEKSKGIKNNNEPIFIVDIGWRGTIQDNLAYIYNNKEIGGYYLTLYDFYNIQPLNTYKLKFISDENIIKNEISSMITLLEWIYNPGTGSVIGYKDGQVIRKAKTQETEIVKKYIEPLQEGMFEGSKIINDYMKYHPYEAEETKKYVYDVIKSVKINPNKELIETYYSMVFNDTFGTGEYVKKEEKLNLLNKFNPIKCRNLLRKETWKEAFIVYNNMNYMKYILDFKSLLRKVLGRK